MNTDTTFARFKKIDAHTHIGAFGSPFNIHFDTERLLQQMETYKIEKTILVASGPHANEDTAAAFRAEPQKIIPLMWINWGSARKAAADQLRRRKEGLRCPGTLYPGRAFCRSQAPAPL